MNDWWGIFWLVVLLAGNAFFVAAEFAVISARRSQVEPKAIAGSRAAKTTLWAMEHVSLMLAVCQLGITICSLLLGNVAEPAIHHLLEGPMHWIGIPAELSGVVSFILALALVSFLHVTVGEIVPKNMALSAADRLAIIVSPVLVFISKVLRPVVFLMDWTANSTLRLFGIQPQSEFSSTYTLDEVQSIVEESKREGVLADETGLLLGALEFSDHRAKDVMLPVDKLVMLSEGATPEDVEQAVAATGYSRFVVKDKNGQPSGYVHIKDVLYADGPEHRRAIPAKRIRSLTSIPLDSDIEDTMKAMQRSGEHLARVVDSSGQVLGVVFLEDIFEELVGEVHDMMQERDRRG